ncbi:hypothetical protein A2291_02010 [candidate division WOR-1 bacterium RIFOXYB2_FULL_42_35]|uniref:Uncharacterized protein n=1 Tax=candidate division WOR-1 bacterium RIFOXYC2_FULL_41_25 TaxID=1802586 RepID=A0A1F4TPT4_UNCSA|nr:MAG: hypothetical protein A2247_03810 [candidate division WOR-1 bacterium RIFOXYA2_FULL_41_14]OGC25178.1 MAG: hypothetical protein A2291_02010 [candidate division WOR-1 bacterium RIFOXYB2_FULL_42_35]OGC34734.1 MAG: hypothetical protein A2462_03325 [candidate division WOR-1 bacterium RIFOXYC2_FULL_41_25]OGC42565.1 MAG: hypothetical protein A2548_07575 [candidate division WOR-1 bacterium RIFOXYD2_FULL_41_8]
MRKIIIMKLIVIKGIVILLLLLMGGTCWAQTSEVQSINLKRRLDQYSDKAAHVLLGGFVAAGAYKHGADSNTMVLSAATVGLLREAFDQYYAQKWDNWDLLATIFGGVLMTVL